MMPQDVSAYGLWQNAHTVKQLRWQRIVGILLLLFAVGLQSGIPLPGISRIAQAERLDPALFGLPASAVEAVNRRTERSATFEVKPGTFAAVSVQRDLFTKDDEGRMVFVSMEGRREGDQFVFDRLAEDVNIMFDLTKPSYELMQNGRGYRIAFQTNATGTIIDDHTVEYLLADGIRLRWSVEGNRVKKDIIVSKKGIISNLPFTVTPIGDIAVNIEENRLVMKTGSGDTVFEAAEPFLMSDRRTKLDESVVLHQQSSGIFSYQFDESALPLPYILDPSEGPNSPGTVTTEAGGGVVSWENPSNVAASDDAYAQAGDSLLTRGFTHYLKPTNFGFNIPAGVTVSGIDVDIERKCSGSSTSLYCTDQIVRLLKAGTVDGDDKADIVTKWGTTDATATYGDSSDLWGATWTADDINQSTFGLLLQARLFSSAPS